VNQGDMKANSSARAARRAALCGRRAGLWVLALVFLWATTAPAQVSPPARAPTPPVAPSNTDVPYPPGANGDAIVLLELTVAADGTVSKVAVIDGVEPFAASARAAVLGWRFAPAHRGSTPIAARIRARVEFHQEQLSAPPAIGPPMQDVPRPAPPTAQQGAAAVPQASQEILVLGTRHEIGQTTLSADEVREMPGAFGDPFRAIEALPGVAPIVSGLPFFYIRGAPPNDNAYLLDGIRVPLLFHVGIGEGVIHPALVDRVDFYPGAAPAAYGGSAGAVIAGQTRDPATTSHGETNLRLIDAGALLESPLGDGRGSALVAGRYGYPGPILGAITPTVKLGYWDYQARFTWRVGGKDTLGVFVFGSHDYIGTASTTNGQRGPIVEQLGSDFHRLDLRYDRALPDGRLRIAATVGYDSQGGAGVGDGAATAGVTTMTDLSTALRLEYDQRLSPNARVRAGADLHLDHYGFAQGQGSNDQPGSPQAPLSESADPPPTNLSGGAHADVVWRVAPRVEVVPGARIDVFASRRANGSDGTEAITTVPAFDPRLSVRLTLTRAVSWLSTLGLSHQYPALRVGAVPAIVMSAPGFPLGNSQLQTVAQASQGVELALPADFKLTTTGFLSEWSGLTDLTANCIQIMQAATPRQRPNSSPAPTPYTCPNNQPVHSRAFGVELLLRRSLSKRFSGWLSYTLSRSTRDEHFITTSGGDAISRVANDYDRTHVLNAIVAYDLGRRWRAGGRFVFMSGAPYSKLSGNVPVPPYNAERDPSFYRVDVRLEKRWRLGQEGYLAFIAEVQNVTLRKEVTPFGLSCQGMEGPQGGTVQCSHAAVGPLTIPSIGAEASF
jgi:hypothetical protein